MPPPPEKLSFVFEQNRLCLTAGPFFADAMRAAPPKEQRINGSGA